VIDVGTNSVKFHIGERNDEQFHLDGAVSRRGGIRAGAGRRT
jgi:exopolyphosphatase/pppGpp-phosphohydrolase